MLNRIIKVVFAILGSITGITILMTVINIKDYNISKDMVIFLNIIVTLVFGVLFYFASSILIETLLLKLDGLEDAIHKITLYELMLSSIGLIAGLLVANLISISIIKLDVIGVPIAVFLNLFMGIIGIALASGKRHETFFDLSGVNKGKHKKLNDTHRSKLLDTSVIIDGRILDLCKSGFIEGEIIIPNFVLEELRKIADSADTIKRNRGKRGLEILGLLQKELENSVKVDEFESSVIGEVDDKLLDIAKRKGYSIVTIDFNLKKIADFQNIKVLNINELANAVKPIALPGEDMQVRVIKDGKENTQGIAYLEDGTMIVVEGGRKFIGEDITVTVTSVLQTAAGRMVFAKPKYIIERVM